MTVCTKCMAQIPEGGQFCGTCGAAAPQAAAASSGPAVPDTATHATPPVAGAEPGGATAAVSAGTALTPANSSAGMAPNVAGLVAYVLGFITAVFLLVSEPYKRDKFVRFHAFQSILVSALYVVLIFAWSMVSGLFLSMGFVALWQLVYFGWWLVRLAFFALWLFLMYKAYNNERFELPILGPIAAKHAGP
jgi:uncharacterized membrane protein